VKGDGVFGDGTGVPVGFSVDLSAFDAAAGEEAGEGPGVVAAAVAMFFLDLGGAAEFGAEDDEGGAQQASFLEVGDEGAVGGVEELAVALHRGEVVVVSVPAAEYN
jgi:hypothetical protein